MLFQVCFVGNWRRSKHIRNTWKENISEEENTVKIVPFFLLGVFFLNAHLLLCWSWQNILAFCPTPYGRGGKGAAGALTAAVWGKKVNLPCLASCMGNSETVNTACPWTEWSDLCVL